MLNHIYRIARKSNGNNVNGRAGLGQGPRFTQNVPGIKSFVRVQGGAEDIKKGTDKQEQAGGLIC